MFIIYNNAKSNALGVGEPQLVDLTQAGTLYINFFDNVTGLKIKLKSYNNIKELNPVNGEVVFKIPSEESNKILGIVDKTYYISTVLETGGGTSEETLLYTGTWYNSKEKADKVASDTITDLQNAYKTLIDASTKTDAAYEAKIKELESNIDYKNQYILALQNALSERGVSLDQIDIELSSSQDEQATRQINQNFTNSRSTSNSNKATEETNAEKVTGTSLKNFKFNE